MRVVGVRTDFARRRNLICSLLLAIAVLQMQGCYYVQAVRGHQDLMSRRVPVDEVIADQESPDRLKAKLALVDEARDFAVTDLMLPDNDSYRSYADLERDYVVWNVFATPEFSLSPKTWCYPVAGCVAYRGYFDEGDAEKLGNKLDEDGYDVVVGGVSAYSTLGRFDDPVLNTMVRWSDVDLVATMFHELAHQKIYIKGDTAFNESFATAVADIGVDRWLHKTGELDRLQVYEQHRRLRVAVQGAVADTRDELQRLYSTEMDEETMRSRKREILDALSAEAQRLIDEDGRNVRNWMAAPLNNARLTSFSLYEGMVDVFKTVYEDCARDIECFYARSSEIGQLGAGRD